MHIEIVSAEDEGTHVRVVLEVVHPAYEKRFGGREEERRITFKAIRYDSDMWIAWYNSLIAASWNGSEFESGYQAYLSSQAEVRDDH